MSETVRTKSSLTHVGLLKTTLLDFPGEVAATLFTPGCNLRCPYCHNPELVQPPYPQDMIAIEDLDPFFKKRARILGGVCITGGEPLLHADLSELIEIIRGYGLKVKLDTNGTFPDRLAELLKRGVVDYVAMDLKTVPELYHERLTGGAGKAPQAASHLAEKVRGSIEILRNSGVPYELRTTVAPGIIGPEEMRGMLPLLDGAERYVLKPFKSGATLDPAYDESQIPSDELMEELCAIATRSVVPCEKTKT